MLKRILPAVLSLIFLASSIVYVSRSAQDTTEVVLQPAVEETQIKPQGEMRGVWVSYMTLDVESETDKESAFKEKIDSIISDMKSANLNTMIVQVRPFSDALYPSEYYPWSHILTGTQGENPGYDPLKYIVENAHENNIAVHAWLNPYRVSTDKTPSELSEQSPYIKDPSICVEIDGSIYLNPSSEEARELIINGAAEIAKNYHVDGIQFDDYFYPPDCGDFDEEDYQAYCDKTESPLSLEEFRFENVNTLIHDVYSSVHSANRSTVFGISPQGNLKNNAKLFADVEKWCAEDGYIDYICPQIYFSLDNPALTFEDGLQDWMELKKHESLATYVGIPAYKAGTNADSGTWLDNSDILETELKITRESNADGFMLYSYDSFHNEENAEEMQNVMRYLTSSPTQ